MQAPGQVQQGSRGLEGSGEGLGGFGAEPGQVQQRSGEDSGEGSGEGSRKPCKPSQVQQGSGEGLGGFGAEPGQVQQSSGGLGGFLRSQVKFHRVPKKAPEKVPGGFGAEPGQVQQGCEEGSGEGSEIRFNRVPEKVRRRSGRL